MTTQSWSELVTRRKVLVAKIEFGDENEKKSRPRDLSHILVVVGGYLSSNAKTTPHEQSSALPRIDSPS